jgi:hypothetical protein
MATNLAERRELYRSRKENGCCPRCGNKIKKSSSVFCDNCLDFYREYTEEHKEQTNANRKILYAEKIENGLCPRCGVKLKNNYAKKFCQNCLDKAKVYSDVKKQKNSKSAAPSIKKPAKPSAVAKPRAKTTLTVKRKNTAKAPGS